VKAVQKARKNNRRKSMRVNIEAALAMMTCLTDQGEAAGAAADIPLISEDISPEGVFLRTHRELPTGQLVRLRVHLPTMLEPMEAAATVMRVERDGAGAVRGVGLAFQEMPEAQRAELLEHVYRSYQAQQTPSPRLRQ
jgi:uncharacterized protein (TIGR02266 family)